MKKILAIILVVAMVMIPLTALAEDYSTARNITVTNDAAKGAVSIVLASDTTKAATKPYLDSVAYVIFVNAKDGYQVDAAKTKLNDVAIGTYVAADGIEIPADADDYKLVVVYKADNFKFVGGLTADADTSMVPYTGFGGVTVSNAKAKSGNVTFTASIKNALATGLWYVDGTVVAKGDPGVVSISAAKLVLDASEFYVVDAEVEVTAGISQAVGTIVGEVDPLNPWGTVKVTWLTKTSAKVEAIANKGAKFVAWTAGDPIFVTAALNPASPVLYITDIAVDDEIVLIASFIKTSGDFTTSTDNATGGKSDNPKTGDNSNVALWTIMGIVALGGIALASKKVFSK